MMLQTGIQFGWNSPNLARFTLNSSSIQLTSEEASWVAASPGLGGVLGGILGSLSINSIGTKRTVLLVFALTTGIWACTVLANSALWFYILRTMSGITTAMSFCSFALFLAEVSAPSLRGTLISFASSGTSFGVVIGTAAESYLPTTISCSIYIVQCFIGLFIFTWLLDSPHHLVKVQDQDGAKKSICFYNGESKVDEELKIIGELVESDAKQNIFDRFREFKTPSVRRSIILIIILFALPHLSGSTTLKSYMEIILVSGRFAFIKQGDLVIYANMIEAVTTFLTVRLIDKLGRKILFMVSSIGTGIAMVGLGLHFYLVASGFDPQEIQWLPILSIMTYVITYAVGFSTVPSTVLSEIFPQNIKSLAACMANFSAASVMFLTLKAYQRMVDIFGEAYVFWLFAAFSFLATPCAIFLLPETKGKSLQEIQAYLAK
ncbi:hypothetical protein QAD02_010695 [Eretmocerus hayati]|uniref:Uncharacterized protein n=1 Tax=Eretmocerus hayati TaxID=131215 RepID=A0ACC2NUY5_9HYME|nr:hypothetical protein QAD02_010695 [Eretmocerus hayati]